MSNNIEIEWRSALDAGQRETMLAYMHDQGGVKRFNRVMIDYTGVDKNKTLMIKINDGVPIMVAKQGSVSAQSRREVILKLVDDPEDALTFLAILGYTNAQVCRRSVHEVEVGNLNVSVRDILSGKTGEVMHTMLEVEIINPAPSRSDELLVEFYNEKKLKRLVGDEWVDWIANTHQAADVPFEYSTQAAKDLIYQLRSEFLLK